MKRLTRATTPAWLVGVALLSAGCFSIETKTAPTVYRYQLAYPAPQERPEPIPAIIRLAQLRTASAYDRTDIVYRDGRHRLGTYNYRRWTVDPARMIGDLIGRDLVDSKMFRAVLVGPTPLAADFVLNGFVEEIEERVDGGSSAHLRIRFTLSHRSATSAAEAVFQKVYEADEPYDGSDIDDLVDAMSRALASISQHLRADLSDAVAPPS